MVKSAVSRLEKGGAPTLARRFDTRANGSGTPGAVRSAEHARDPYSPANRHQYPRAPVPIIGRFSRAEAAARTAAGAPDHQ